MKPSYLALVSGLILIVIVLLSWCGRNPAQLTTNATPSATPINSPAPPVITTPTPSVSATASPSSTPSPTPTPTPSLTPSANLQKAVKKAAPAVVLVTTFDSSGQLLHNGTGFFISSDGRLVTSWRLVEGGAHAVAKSADGKIRNVTGVIASSAELDLAVLRAETKIGVPFLRFSRTAEPTTPVAVVGSSLERREQPIATIQIPRQETESNNNGLVASVSLPPATSGAPLIDEDGNVMGVVTSARDTSGASGSVVRPVTALESLASRITPDTVARWPGAEAESPAPSPTPKKLRIVSNPAPVYPLPARRANPPIAGSGRFRIVFAPNGDAREVQIVRSTGQTILDQAAVEAFSQWKSEPGHEWSLIVPITFRP
jgi:TonB family protein